MFVITTCIHTTGHLTDVVHSVTYVAFLLVGIH